MKRRTQDLTPELLKKKWRLNHVGLKFFKKRSSRKSKDNIKTKIIFSRTDINWVFNKIINHTMKNGKKEVIEKGITQYFISKKKQKKKNNRPKMPLLFWLGLLNVFRPVVSLDKTTKLEENEMRNHNDRNTKKIIVTVPNLLSVKKQYSFGLLWIAAEIKNFCNNNKNETIQKSKQEEFNSSLEKKKVISLRKKIIVVFDKICKKQKQSSFFWEKAEIYSNIIINQTLDFESRWK